MKITKLTRASMAGDVVRTGISRRTGRSGRQWSAVEHIATVDHFFGLDKKDTWVVPLCGAKPGKGSFADSTNICQRCLAAAKRRGYEMQAVES